MQSKYDLGILQDKAINEYYHEEVQVVETANDFYVPSYLRPHIIRTCSVKFGRNNYKTGRVHLPTFVGWIKEFKKISPIDVMLSDSEMPFITSQFRVDNLWRNK